MYQNHQKNIGKGLFKESNVNIQKNKKAEESIVDGEGIRTVIWMQGWPHHCKGCHNKETNLKELLLNIDVLVDGPFILELKSYDVLFRGSSNQWIIDSKKSIIENKVCEIQK